MGREIIVVSSCMSFWLSASILALLVQIFYWAMLRKGFSEAQRPSSHLREYPVSILVAARNEEACLMRLLTALSTQDATEYEVVVVDDGSTDSTPDILEHASSMFRDGQLRVITVDQPRQPRKKNALTLGIQAARYDRLLFTDADCVPGPTWATDMSKLLEHPERTVVVGYSPFQRSPGFLNKLARYETFVTGYFTAAAIGLERPYMAVGRNIAYGKSTFQRIGGFTHSEHVLSGDDDLFIQEVVRRD
ncbi:MAG: glycosyltransferase, partial [Rhodothermales bacterium]|nr:glycosyltransferase [Rhodothermales bacterium]